MASHYKGAVAYNVRCSYSGNSQSVKYKNVITSVVSEPPEDMAF